MYANAIPVLAFYGLKLLTRYHVDDADTIMYIGNVQSATASKAGQTAPPP